MAFSGSGFGAAGVGGLDEIAAIRRELEAIKQIMDELQPQLEKAPRQLETFKQLESVARRYLILANRMGFKGNVSEAIREASRLIVTIRQAHIAFAMLRAALSAGDPISILAAGAAIGLTAANVASYAEDSTYDNTWGM